MEKWMISVPKVWLMMTLILVNTAAAWGQESAAQRSVREYYERIGAEKAACNLDPACLDRVRGEHARERARAMRELMGPTTTSNSMATTPKGSAVANSARPTTPTQEKQVLSSEAPGEDEFDLGDLDF